MTTAYNRNNMRALVLVFAAALVAFGQSIITSQRTGRGGVHTSTRNPAAAPVVRWVTEETFGGSANDRVNFITTDQQGFVYIAGSTTSEDFPATPGAFQQQYQQPSIAGAFDNFLVKLDPSLSKVIYATYLGPGDSSGISRIAVDSAGNVFFLGITQSHNFPTTSNAFERIFTSQSTGFAGKLSADGTTLLYSTYLSGAYPGGLAVDSNGAMIIAGSADRGAIASSPNAIQNAPPLACNKTYQSIVTDALLSRYGFILKLNPDTGAPEFATYLSGSCGSSIYGVTLDDAGSILVAGETYSEDYPVTEDALAMKFPGLITSGFVSKISSSGDNLLYSTFFGGGAATDARGIAIDADGRVTVVGSTQGKPTPGAFANPSQQTCPPIVPIVSPLPIFLSPIPSNPYDAYAMKFKPGAAQPDFLATFGGGCQDSVWSVSLDPSGNIWMTGNTSSSDFTTAAPFAGLGDTGNNAFIAELSADGSTLLFSKITANGYLAIGPNGAPYFAASIPDSSKTVPPNTSPYTTVQVWELDPAPPPIVLDRIISLNQSQGISPWFLPANFAPGQIVRVQGRDIGPADKVDAKLTADDQLETTVAGVTVTFNGVIAPLVSVQANEIICLTPFALDGKTSADVQVEYNGQKSNIYAMSVAQQSGDFIAVLNADGTPNSYDNPASLGSSVTIYLTGLGPTSPGSPDGSVTRASGIQLAKTPLITASGNTLIPTYIGAAPNEVAGVTQINLPATDPGASNSLAVYVASAFHRIYITKP